ncbi:MAG: hypothetical protein J3Q66DRAFT_337405 [Benniella sp.]|nr:MAG: hypothetical protein J3Q66DRAFT_337405 [Benniella sp.]
MTSELILYLEPTRSSTLSTQVNSFFALCRDQPWHNNEALRYPPHVTMVGFFDDPSATLTTAAVDDQTPPPSSLLSPPPSVAEGSILDQMIQFLTHQIQQMMRVCTSKSSLALVQGLIRPRQDSALIAIQPSPLLLDLIQSIKDRFPELGLRLKRINHLSLCYWDDDGTRPPQPLLSFSDQMLRQERTQWTDQAVTLALDQIHLLSSIAQGDGFLNESWDIVLYSIRNRDKSNGQPYPLEELKRWTLSL